MENFPNEHALAFTMGFCAKNKIFKRGTFLKRSWIPCLMKLCMLYICWFREVKINPRGISFIREINSEAKHYESGHGFVAL